MIKVNSPPILLFLFCCGYTSFAQISIDPVSTDTVNILDQRPAGSNRKETVALWSTLLIPGSGHRIAGYQSNALGYISADVASLCGALFFHHYEKKINTDSRSFAALYAGAAASVNEEYYWQVVANNYSYDDFHETLGLERDKEKRFLEQKFYFQWQDTSYQNEFVSMQKTAKRLGTVSSFFLVAMILNRVVAFIDLRSALKNVRYQGGSSLSFKEFSPNHFSHGIMLSSEF